MSVIHNDLLLATDEATGYNLTKSLRLRASASAYLNRTMTTPTNNLKWTLSAWVKRGSVLTTENQIINAGTTGSDDQFVFTSSSQLAFYVANGASYYLVTNAVYRDPAAWYHIVFVYDSANATASNRLLMYVNGTQVTSFATALYPTQNYASQINSAVLNRIGLRSNSSAPFDGYMTEVNFIDGQALTPSSFGETDTITGVWKPKAFAGTYGTNGFYLPFTDVATTSGSNAGLGKDFSGNANYWNTNNISVTAGSTYDSMNDVPTLTSATAANYCVLNPLDKSASLSAPTNGNLNLTNPASAWNFIRSTIGITSGKWYAEITQTGSNSFIGVMSGSSALSFGSYGGSDGVYAFFNNGAGITGYPYANGTSGTVFVISSGDIIGLAYDYDAQTLAIYRNNSLQATVTSIPKTAPMFFCAGFAQTTATHVWNYGQQGFTYTPPSGFKALNTYNLPDSTIVAGNKYMDATTYTGNGSTQTITNAGGFKPDLVWAKVRSTGYSHRLVDSVRGATKLLFSDLANAESTDANSLTSFNSNGFSLGNAAGTNDTSQTFVGWQWQAGQGTTSSNTNGSITSTVSVNATAGFSIVTYTGTGANATVGHGLGIAPKMLFVKNRTGVYNWRAWHTTLPGTDYLFLTATDAVASSSTYWNSTVPTSTVFSIGTNAGVNNSGDAFVAYCWSEIAGFSKFGSYTGNGSADGTFVYTGFRPKFLLIKRTDTTGDWWLEDTSRNSYNAADLVLFPNTNGAESGSSVYYWDFLSNGFKLRSTTAGYNASGGTYIYMAFAENPFKNALAR